VFFVIVQLVIVALVEDQIKIPHLFSINMELDIVALESPLKTPDALFPVIVQLDIVILEKSLQSIPFCSCSFTKENVRRTVSKLDAPIMKLDLGSEKLFRDVNRPCKDVSFNEVLRSLKKLDNVIIQTLLFKGKVSNVSDEALSLLIKRLREVKPKYVQVYTVDRPPAEPQIRKVDEKVLSEVAYRIGEEVGVPAEIYSLKCPSCGNENLSYVVLPSGEQFYQCKCGYRRKVI